LCEERLTAKQQRLQEAVQYISEDSALEQAVRTQSGSHLHLQGGEQQREGRPIKPKNEITSTCSMALQAMSGSGRSSPGRSVPRRRSSARVVLLICFCTNDVERVAAAGLVAPCCALCKHAIPGRVAKAQSTQAWWPAPSLCDCNPRAGDRGGDWLAMLKQNMAKGLGFSLPTRSVGSVINSLLTKVVINMLLTDSKHRPCLEFVVINTRM